MDQRTRTLLEFEEIKRAVGDECLSALGRERVIDVEPAQSVEEVQGLLDRVQEWSMLFAEGLEPHDLVFPDIREPLETLRKPGTVLESEDLVAVARFLQSAGILRRSLRERGEIAPILAEESVALPEPPELIKTVFRRFDATGEVREENWPELTSIRSRIRDLKQRIAETARRFMSDAQLSAAFSTDAAASKEGRTVLPVKSDHKGKVPGVVHDVSSSGRTVFVEPFELVEQNNALVAEQGRYAQEVRRVLRELTDEMREHFADLETVVEAVVYFDGLRARARYGYVRENRRVEPGPIRLMQARHPHIPRASVVPIDICPSEGIRCLVVTGPNTGGKTVALKTLGLIALMNQFGLFAPVADGSSLPVFDAVYADIGDEQSIEQSLSTFSGHLTNIARYLERAAGRSLVLLDELGAGTDPQEGGALALAIMDRLLTTGCFAVVTTHHGSLKRYGYAHEEVENASMEFDSESLSPTFRMRIGVPGGSHALEIAGRVGLPEDVIAAAHRYLEGRRSDTAQVLADLQEKEHELDRLRGEMQDRQDALDERAREQEEREAHLDEKRRRIASGKLDELESFAAEARSTLENLVRKLREQERPLTKEDTRAVKDYIRDLDQELAARRGELEAEAESSAGRSAETPTRDRAPAGTTVCEGMSVRVRSTGREGHVVRRDKKGRWLVQTGSLKIALPESDLEPLATDRKPSAGERHVAVSVSGQRPGPQTFELDVRGLRLHEAIDRVEQHIQDCLAGGTEYTSILHGKGTGALQQGIREHLSGRTEISEVRFARPEEGGTGKTVVVFRF